MNKFNERQNEEASIDKLAAQNQLYGDAKKRLGIYLTLSIPIMILLNVAVKPILLNDTFNLGLTFDLTDSIALYALLLAGYELIFLKRKMSTLKQKAAKIQEDFDCTVYCLEWNELLSGDKECELEIKKSSDKYSTKRKNREDFINWYTPEIEKLSDNKAILVCQKENLGWDIEQRTKFNYFISIISIVVLVSSLIVGFYFEFTLKSLILSAIIPSWPAISFAISNYYENNEAIEDKKTLKLATEKVEQLRTPSVKYIRNIQNLIFLNRKNNCLIFDWFYKYHFDSNQSGISYASRQLIQRLF
jgi:hypothetical protein